jgi:threonine/homoserine/homoserine lactone efflux protein
MAAILLSSMALAFSGAVMPGPMLTYTIRQSLSTGSKAGFLITLGHALLELLLIVVIFFGFDIILQSVAAQTAIGLVGGALLSYMGVDMVLNALRDKLKIDLNGDGNGNRNMVLSGAAISAMNPYFLIWWAIIGLGFLLSAYQGFGIWGIAAFYIGHIATDFLWYGALSIIIGKTRRFISQKVYRVIVATLGAVLIYFGTTFVVKAIQAIV